MRWEWWIGMLISLGLAQPFRWREAAPRTQMRERIQSLRIAYLSQEMELMPEEAQAFWPIYNAREAELQKARQTLRVQLRTLEEKKEQLSPEAYADSVSQAYLSLWQREAEIRRNFHDKFKRALPPAKLARFYLAELRLLRRALGESPEGE